MLVQTVTLFSIAISIIIIGIFIYTSNKSNLLNKLFLAVSLFTALWCIGIGLFINTNNLEIADILIKLYYISALGIAISFNIFTNVYTNHKFTKINIFYIGIATIIATIIFVDTSFIAKNIILTNSDYNSVTLNSYFYLFYSLFIMLNFLESYRTLYKSYKTSIGTAKLQIRTLIKSFTVSTFIGLVFNLVLPFFGLYEYIWVGPISVGIFSYGMFIAIKKHQMFNVRKFASITVAYIMSIFIVVIVYVSAIAMLFNLFLFANNDLDKNQLLVYTLSAILLILIFEPIRSYFNHLTSNIFYRDGYDEKDFINEINYKIVNSKEHELLLDWVVNNINKKMHLKYCAIYIDPNSALDRHLFSTNIAKFNIETFGQFLKKIDTNNIIIDRNDSTNNTDVNELMDELELEAVAKMYSLDEVIGYLIIGPKKSGSAITQSDVKVLKILSDSLAVATQNELRYQEIAKFNLTLKQNIDTATKELQATNKKLQSLDEAKDEFISMASHQLRTPLTSIKGYISMILEGDAGDINEQQRNFLNQAFISSQRMVFLISDLLNVSRLKTGKFVIEKAEADLCEMVQSEVDQLIPTAEGRGLSLEFKAPDNYPKVVLDETKTLQVIMNFIDNAIYYTPKGGHIKVELSHDDTSVTYKVIDNGLGVPKAVQHELFTKFYRAENAKKARPDGTGLGLYMAKKVVIAQGGHIIFESQEGKGSTFGFSLPLGSQ